MKTRYKEMKKLTAIVAISIMAFFPIAAYAQGFGNLNINLNDVMVGQRMQDMSQRLNDANSASIFTPKKHHQKHEKRNKNHKMALMSAPDATSANDNNATITGSPQTVTSANPAATPESSAQ